MNTFRAESLEDAIAIAERRKQEGTHDWFRGQRRDHRLKAKLLRLDEEAREEAKQVLTRLEHWAQTTPGLEELAARPDELLAVAQHHGIPTPFVDFTTEPEVAGYFATDGWTPGEGETGVILCVDTKDLLDLWTVMPAEYHPAPECLRLHVKNLWRLEAQHGVFLWCPYDGVGIEAVYGFDRIVFPHGTGASRMQRDRIYPERKSPLEILLDQFFMNEMLIQRSREIATWPGTRIHVAAPDPGEEGDSLVRALPLQPSWSAEALRPWLLQEEERLAHVRTDLVFRVPADLPDPATAAGLVRQGLAELLREAPHARAKSVGFPCDDAHLGAALVRLWDGLRRLPYEDDEVVEGMANAAALATTFRLRGGGAVHWSEAAREWFGQTIEVEFGAADGSHSRGHVEPKLLLDALRPDFGRLPKPKRWQEDALNAKELLLAVNVPARLFDFRRLATLFATRLAPYQAVARPYAAFYSPARVEAFGLP